MPDPLEALRRRLAQSEAALAAAEAELAQRLADIQVLEQRIEAQLGPALDQLTALEAEVQLLLAQIQRQRNASTFGQEYRPVEEQFRRTWVDPEPPPTPIASAPAGAAPPQVVDLKRLYRQLARRYHPDLTTDEAERQRRTAVMAAINEAYASHDLAALQRVDQAVSPIPAPIGPAASRPGFPQTTAELQAAIAACQQRQQAIATQLQQLEHHPTVQLSLDIALARRQRRELLAEMLADLQQKIARKQVERDMMAAQFAQLGRRFDRT